MLVLNWRPDLSAPSDIMKALLKTVSDIENFLPIIEKANYLITLSLIYFEISSVYSSSSIALGSLFSTLDYMGLYNIARDISLLIRDSNIGFNIEET